MKKIIYILFFAAFALTSCDNTPSDKKPIELKTVMDSLSYALGVQNGADSASFHYYIQQFDKEKSVEKDYFKGLWKGLTEGIKEIIKTPETAADRAFNDGVNTGEYFQARLLHVLNQQLMLSEDSLLSKEAFFCGFRDAVTGKVLLKDEHGQPYTTETVYTFLNENVQKLLTETFSARYPKEKANSEAYMKEVASRKDLKPLVDGIYYREIAAGDSTQALPKPNETVRVVYEGRLTNGSVFDATVKHGKDFDEFNLGNVIPGWTKTITRMSPGAIWEVYLPYDQAYGAAGTQNGIPPFAPLVFNIQLLDVKTAAAE